ncbi:hypothetical protein JCM5350_004982 [Sporobolomyces pararoseus]
MDRLPPELLKMIADSIEQEIQPFTRQRTLAALARTNKTFYSICNSRIYVNPVLGDDQMVKKWTRFYISQVNTWTVCRGSKSFRNVIVPSNIQFNRFRRTKSDTSSAPPNSQNIEPPAISPLILFQSVISPPFFRNLVSFSASSKSTVDTEFILALIGPDGSNRASIQRLHLRQSQDEMLLMYLLEGYNRMYFDGPNDLFQHPLAVREHEIDRQRIMELEKAENPEYMAFEGWKELDRLEEKLYAASFPIFRQLWPASARSEEMMEAVENTRDILARPFASLVNLNLIVSEVHEFYLLLHSKLFPSLTDLKLVGEVDFVTPSAYDVKLLRHSVTKNEGEIRPPSVDDYLEASYPQVFNTSWKPLSTEEMEEQPKIDYFGPNLNKLDLSECDFVHVF